MILSAAQGYMDKNTCINIYLRSNLQCTSGFMIVFYELQLRFHGKIVLFCNAMQSKRTIPKRAGGTFYLYKKKGGGRVGKSFSYTEGGTTSSVVVLIWELEVLSIFSGRHKLFPSFRRRDAKSFTLS